MVRTKVNNQAKRDRNHHNLEGMQQTLREFDSASEGIIADIDRMYNDEVERLSSMFRTLRNKIPQSVLSMKMGDLSKAQQASTLKEIDDMLLAASVFPTISHTTHSSGYQTESDYANDVEPVPDKQYLEPVTTAKNSSRPLGPLASAMKNRRRSKSVSYTPAQSAIKSLQTKKTINDSAAAGHKSRSKYRTPATSRSQAVSADRIYTPITPKVAPNTPLAVFRRARIGETCYSLTGSPVIAPTVESVANVNIPIGDGVVTIRPTEFSSIDSASVPKFDPETWNHLKVLQQNLNTLMEAAGLMDN